jgi:hypothetical protein
MMSLVYLNDFTGSINPEREVVLGWVYPLRNILWRHTKAGYGRKVLKGGEARFISQFHNKKT